VSTDCQSGDLPAISDAGSGTAVSASTLPQQCPSLMVWHMCLVWYGADHVTR